MSRKSTYSETDFHVALDKFFLCTYFRAATSLELHGYFGQRKAMMNTELEKLFGILRKSNVIHFISRKSVNTICIVLEYKRFMELLKQSGISAKFEGLSIWHNQYKGKGYTFLKNMESTGTNKCYATEDDGIDKTDALLSAFSRDEICDPDILEYYDSVYSNYISNSRFDEMDYAAARRDSRYALKDFIEDSYWFRILKYQSWPPRDYDQEITKLLLGL